MPPIETFHRTDKALWWPKSTTGYGVDDYGNPIVADDYEEVWVRWEEGRGQVRNSVTGELISYDVVVVVDQEMKIGGEMWKGSADDYETDLGTDGTDDDELEDVMVIVERGHIEDLKGRYTRRVVYLQRKNDADPGVANWG